MRVAKIKLKEEDLKKLEPEFKRLKIGFQVVEIYIETEEILKVERSHAVAKQLVKDLAKEMYDLKFPKK